MQPLRSIDISGMIVTSDNEALFIDGYPINPHLWINHSSLTSTIAFDIFYKTVKLSEHLNVSLLTYDGQDLKYVTELNKNLILD